MVAFPGVGEVCRYVNGVLPLAVGSSHHSNVNVNVRLKTVQRPSQHPTAKLVSR